MHYIKQSKPVAIASISDLPLHSSEVSCFISYSFYLTQLCVSPCSHSSKHSMTEYLHSSTYLHCQPSPFSHLHVLLLIQKVSSSSVTQFSHALRHPQLPLMSASAAHTQDLQSQLLVFNNFLVRNILKLHLDMLLVLSALQSDLWTDTLRDSINKSCS